MGDQLSPGGLRAEGASSSPPLSPGRRRPAAGDLRRAVLTRTVDPKGRIRRIMQELDENGDGELQVEEILELFRGVRQEHGSPAKEGEGEGEGEGEKEDPRMKAVAEHLRSTFAGADTDGSKGISPSEFLKAIEDPDHPLSLVWDMFAF